MGYMVDFPLKRTCFCSELEALTNDLSRWGLILHSDWSIINHVAINVLLRVRCILHITLLPRSREKNHAF